MKYLTILFSLYMTLVTLMPCQDGKEYVNSKTTVTSIQKSTKEVEHNGQEICPPFCVCSCCSVSRDFIQHKTERVVISDPQIPYSEYKIPAIVEQPIEIYQPPKLV